MKNKFIILTLCFTIIFTNINLNSNKSYASPITPSFVEGGVITAPMVAVVSTVAVACGIAINDNSDLYDVASIFYEKYKDNQEIIKNTFDLGVSILGNKVVTVSKEFMELIKGAFDDYSLDLSDSVHIPGYGLSKPIEIIHGSSDYIFVEQGSYTIKYNKSVVSVYLDDVLCCSVNTNLSGSSKSNFDFIKLVLNSEGKVCLKLYNKEPELTSVFLKVLSSQPIINAFPGFNDYDWDKIADKVEQGSVGLHMPGYLGDLIGKNPSDVVSDGVNANPYDKPYDDTITLPNINNPSIDSTLDGTFNPSLDTDIPGTSNPSVPNEGIWSTIKDFVISLVVPSDTFWTDTFNGFRDNFSKNFPMLDMSKFDSLAVGGKPFPNLYAYGSKIVDGDVINSIVDWLRPIIAGFIMICLMFFNYRKIYKLIRNTEPFGGIAQGSSDFRTGLSAPPINNGLDSNPMGNLRDTLFDMRNEILRRENEK